MGQISIQKKELDDPAKEAGVWLAESGIQSRSNQKNNYGGVYAWWNIMTGQHSFIYSEITGYAINAYLFLYKTFGDPIYLDCARHATDWVLKSHIHESGLLATRYEQSEDLESYYNSNIFSFDQWMVVYGLCNASIALHDDRCLKRAQAMANFLLDHTRKENGSFYPLFNLKTAHPEEMSDKWSRESGSFLSKALLGLQALHKLTQLDRYKESAVALAHFALNKQDSSGRFITQDNENSTHLHPCLYTIEGLLSFAIATKNQKIAQRAGKSFEWILNTQGDQGELHTYFVDRSFLPFERTDVLAQTLRIGSILFQYSDYFQDSYDHFTKLKERLLTYQIRSGTQKGGFLYGQEENGVIHYHVNAWVTMFATQALTLFDNLSTKTSKYKFEFFV